MIGKTLSHFRILEKVDEGGMGVVYRAVDEADGQIFIAMELIEGVNLDVHLERSEPLTLPDLLDITLQIAEGMTEAHSKRIVHLDLKPGNVMIGRHGRVRHRVRTGDPAAAPETAASDPAPPEAPAGRPATIAVFPFTIRGGGEYAYLREGLVDLLTTKLDGAGELRTVDSHSILCCLPVQAEGPQEPAARAEEARQFGAGLFLLGHVLAIGGRLHIDASLYESGDPSTAVSKATAQGETDRIFEMVDDLSAKLLAGRCGGPDARFSRIAAVTTGSFPALESYLEGEGEMRRMRRAPAVEAVEAVLRGANDEAERLYRTCTGTRPDDLEAWYQLAEVQFHYGPQRGRTLADSRPAWERVLSLDPDHVNALVHLGAIAASTRDHKVLERTSRRAEERAEEIERLGDLPDSGHLVRDLAVNLRAHAAAARGRHREALAFLDQARMESRFDQSFLSPFYSQACERYIRAGLLARLGRPREALPWYGSFAQNSLYDLIYLGPSHLARGEIHAERGETGQAIDCFENFLALWSEADPEMQGRVGEAKRRMAGLRGGSA